LQSLLDEVPEDGRQSAAIRVELCAADLEWRWRCTRDAELLERTSTGQVEAPQPTAIKKRPLAKTAADTDGMSTQLVTLPQRPSAKDYAFLLGHVWELEAWRAQLQLAEWKARSALGDQPDLIEFTGLSSQADWNELLLEALEEIAWLRVTLDDMLTPTVCRRMPPEFVMGRQFRDEAPPPTWLADERKLVVAARTDTNISRQQILVQRTQVFQLNITNLSSKVPIRIDDKVLPAHASVQLEMPVRIAFAGLKVIMDAVTR
jgi:hypothetical protein